MTDPKALDVPDDHNDDGERQVKAPPRDRQIKRPRRDRHNEEDRDG